MSSTVIDLLRGARSAISDNLVGDTLFKIIVSPATIIVNSSAGLISRMASEGNVSVEPFTLTVCIGLLHWPFVARIVPHRGALVNLGQNPIGPLRAARAQPVHFIDLPPCGFCVVQPRGVGAHVVARRFGGRGGP